MKYCPRCDQVKPLSAFSRNARARDGVQSMCKACRRLYDHERYERLQGRSIEYVPLRSERGRRAWLRGLKEGKPCADCGKTFPPEVMQWDHRPGVTKRVELSAAYGDWTREEVLREIASCDVVCTNCHAIRTFGRATWGEKWLKDAAVAYDAP